MDSQRLSAAKIGMRTAAGFFVIASLWIVFSDRAVLLFTDNAQLISLLQTVKGWLFVGVVSILLFFVIRRDVCALDAAQDELRHREALYRSMIELAPVAIFIVDSRGAVSYANAAAALTLRATSPEMLLGKPIFNFVPAEWRTKVDRWLRQVLTEGLPHGSAELPFIRTDRSLGHARFTAVPFTLDGTPAIHVMAQDTTESHEQQARVERLAYFDPLTGLPSRIALRERIENLAVSARETGRPISLLLLDVDGFDRVNFALGYANGDRLLQELAKRIRGILGPGRHAARIGASVFAIVSQAPLDPAAAERDARALLEALQQPVLLRDVPIDIRLNAGLSRCPGDAADGEMLLRNADASRAVSKSKRGSLVIYDNSFEVDPQTLSLMAELRTAIAVDELVLEYQPKLELTGRTVREVEALVRWNHPGRGLLGPDAFIPLAEQTGVVNEVTLWVARNAAGQAARWRDEGLELGVAINISARDLWHESFADAVLREIAAGGGQPGWLTLEVTESMMMHEPEHSIAVLNRLRDAGIRLSVDDYGTGYSCLAYLARLPVEELKIDKSFVAEMGRSVEAAKIVRSTTGLAHELGLKVTAEGVEDSAALTALQQMGCDAAQGYGISRPQQAAALKKWLADRA